MTDLPSSRQVVATPMSGGKTPERAVANRAVAVAIRSSRTPAIEAAADSMVVANKRANCIVSKCPGRAGAFVCVASSEMRRSRAARTIAIVFASVGDPVASGLVERLDRPSGNVTGFAAFEASLAGKWGPCGQGGQIRGNETAS